MKASGSSVKVVNLADIGAREEAVKRSETVRGATQSRRSEHSGMVSSKGKPAEDIIDEDYRGGG